MPPPPPPAPPPANTAAPPPAKDLLKSIQKGAKLKKAVTNDRSGPFVEGPKTAPTNSGGGRSPPMSRGGMGSGDTGNGPQLGGLFAGGMPKLKPSGANTANASSNHPSSAQNTQTGASSNAGLAAALLARSASGGNVNSAVNSPSSITSSHIPPPTAPRKEQNPVLMLPSRNSNNTTTPNLVAPRSNSFTGPPIVPSRPLDQTSPSQLSDNIPPRPMSHHLSSPPPAAHRNTMSKPTSLLNPTSSRGDSPRTSTSIINGGSNGSLNQTSAVSNTSQSMNHISNTIQDGRWLFHSDIPLPRQWPSGDLASGGQHIGGLAKSRPPPPPPSRSAAIASKRPPPPPPGR